ncbi:hypothetical protein D5S18_32665 [Nocardia panacis]|uniref:Low molecular weight antigen MTB12-like C-terminal domain-containing protein n=1 Tax=Nocardia panacis TaxID=2340916 RepID=A0A3A4K7J2_9NOCA|nr:hypothetical protein [Nocardia panacis]RJO68194.1 hypothetical protein D5S18_32665 [Nocardia panacis]
MFLPASTLRRALAATAATLAVTAAVAGCGSDDKATTAATTTTTAAADHSAIAAPSADELRANLSLIADPTKPTADKVAAIVNGDKRTANIEAMNAGLAHYALSFAVSDIKTEGARTAAKVDITSPHGTAPVPMTWERTEGKWKLSDASACTMFGFAKAPCTP